MASTLAKILMWVGLAGEDTTGKSRKIAVDDNGQVKVSMSSDIQIGAVEMKDGTTDARAKVGAGSGAAVGDNALFVADANVKAAVVALQAALKGAGNKDLSTVQTQIDAVTSAITALQSALKGASNKDLTTVETAIALLRTTLVGASTKDLTTLQAAITTLQGTGTDTLTTLISALRGASTKDLSTIDALLTILSSAINQTDDVVRAEVLSTTPPTPTDPAAWTQLTAPGYTAAEDVEDNLSHTIQYVVAAIDTNVVVRAEGSLDDAPDPVTGNWFVAVADVTITANGTYKLTSTDRMKWIRFRFVSEDGGDNSATIDARLFSGR